MDALVAEMGASLAQAPAERTPLLDLNGFSGPLEHLLGLARAHEIDLARLSLPHLIDQLTAAMQQAVPLGQKADWVVMAAWLVQLRSQLFLPVEAPAQQGAETTAGQLRQRLVRLQEVQALAAWLEARSQLGRDVFARGQPEVLGACFTDEAEVDVVEFLWAAMALFDDDLPQADTAARYQPRWLDLYSIPDARLRILRLLAEAPAGRPLDQLLPEPAGAAGAQIQSVSKRRSAWTSTFVAGLELARQGEVVLGQAEPFSPIQFDLSSSYAL